MQSKVVEVQAADTNAGRNGEACDFGETAIELSGGKSAGCLSYLFSLFLPQTPRP